MSLVRRAIVSVAAVSVAAALTLVVTVSPAAADVVVDPSESTQGAATRLTFRILNENPTTSIVKVDMLLPAAAPIADVYPLSVEDWAPSMTMRTLATPLQSLHGPLITEAVASVTWTAVEGHALPPGKTAELYLSVGPLPEVARLAIGVVLTDSAGAAVRWTVADGVTGDRAAPAIALRPEAPPPAAAPPAAQPPADGSYLPWTFAILAGVGLLTIWGLWTQRRRRNARSVGPDIEEENTADKELIHH